MVWSKALKGWIGVGERGERWYGDLLSCYCCYDNCDIKVLFLKLPNVTFVDDDHVITCHDMFMSMTKLS